MHGIGLSYEAQIEQGYQFCTWQAISFVLCFLSALLPTVRKEKIWYIYAAACATNNAIDEIRRHAEQIDPIERDFAIVATLWLMYMLNKKGINAVAMKIWGNSTLMRAWNKFKSTWDNK